jgi:hypothetical protein
MKKKQDDSSSVLTSGIYYSDISGKITDLYKISYNPDNPHLFDIECLTDQSVLNPFDKDRFFQKIIHEKYYFPYNETVISYKNRKNVDLLIDTIHQFYSNITGGIRQTNPIPSNNSRMFTKLRSLLHTRKRTIPQQIHNREEQG